MCNSDHDIRNETQRETTIRLEKRFEEFKATVIEVVTYLESRLEMVDPEYVKSKKAVQLLDRIRIENKKF